ncbi:MAG TPA: helix-turn-helix domain-containing protein [Candidatus Binatia bacterium]|nr:helix-turn-helix domain-containing protein [Candidatus Binatia bacterium]
MSAREAATRLRQTSDERRNQVVEAAIRVFAESGYEAASTAAIAERAGISQPYIYALFPSKRDLFLAAHDRVIGRIRATFRDAARRQPKGGPDPCGPLHQMGHSYPDLIGDRYELLMQLQSYAAAGDPEIRRHVARSFQALADDIARLSGASPREIAEFLAQGMLANVTTILGLPEICEPLWHDPDSADPADHRITDPAAHLLPRLPAG